MTDLRPNHPKYETAVFAVFYLTITAYAMLVIYTIGRLVTE